MEHDFGPQTLATPALWVSWIEATSVIVRIEYQLQDPAEGLEFVVPTELYPYVSSHQAAIIVYRWNPADSSWDSVSRMHTQLLLAPMPLAAGYHVWIICGSGVPGICSSWSLVIWTDGPITRARTPLEMREAIPPSSSRAES